MQNERLTQLFSLEETDNQDPLIKYMIALELKKNNDLSCEKYFLILFNEFPEFLANYYIAGEYFYNKEDYKQSYEILEKGFGVAKAQNNQKAISEIKNLLTNVEMELL